MSTYKRITKHPNTGVYEYAEWIDDYFAHHIYGVKFPSDEKVYPTEMIKDKQIKNFWAQDVIMAYETISTGIDDTVDFLNAIQKQYKERWERDPTSGEGAEMP